MNDSNDQQSTSFTNSEIKKLLIEHINETFDDIISEPIDSQIIQIKDDINFCKTEAEKMEPLVSDIKNGKNKASSQKEINLIADQAEFFFDIYLREQQLQALIEMKAIYYYKSLEISLKKILETMYSIKSTTIFGWDDIKKAFKENDIYISKFDGYKEVIELKNVCGNIKHYSKIGEKLKSIQEFKNTSSMTYREIEKFYQRINFPVKNFLNILTDELLYKINTST